MRSKLAREAEYHARPPQVMYVHTAFFGTYEIRGGYRALKLTNEGLWVSQEN